MKEEILPQGNSNVEGIVRSFEKLPLPGKIAIVGVTLAVVVIAFLAYKNRQSSSTSSAVPIQSNGNAASGFFGSTSGGILSQTGNQLTVPKPPPIGTPGYSNHRYIYTIKQGDTLSSLTARAGWDAAKQKGGGVGFLYNYNGNQAIFQNANISTLNPNAQLPIGLQISL